MIEITSQSKAPIEIDISNKFVNLASTQVNQVVDNLFNETFTIINPMVDDVLVHDGNTFKNTPKVEITDGGNF